MVADSGGHVSFAPQVEMQMGHGWPPVGKARELGLRPSLSIDVVTTVPGDMFTQLRAAFAVAREPVNAASFEADTPVPETMLTAREVLEMATVNGALTAGLADRVGALIPGRRADVILIDARALSTAPVRDPAAAVVLSADVSTVDTVIVDGVARKLHGELLADTDRVRRLVEESRDRLDRAVAGRKRATG
jgi:cytosine/adenosine deaminase-related metal-dependent hydrolase